MSARRGDDRDNYTDHKVTGKFGTQKRILLPKMDVKSAFRQVGVAPDRAGAFAYRLKELVFDDLQLQFGW